MAIAKNKNKNGPLFIWMNGEKVGVWDHKRSTFQYDVSWITNPYCRALSLSLPIVPGNVPFKGDAVHNYFDNLLPDADGIRRRLAIKFQAAGADAANLLAAVGRDCVGAIQILPVDHSPDPQANIEGIPLDDEQVAEILRNTTSAGGPNIGGAQDPNDGLRLSIAGAQEKNALLLFDNQWYIPVGTTPTTHILKLPLGLVGNMKADMSTSVENEWLCSRIMRGFGIPVANCLPMTFGAGKGAMKALVVERFDRVHVEDAGTIIRLPQEDMCQALGYNSLAKYEADGGPNALDIMNLLRSGRSPGQDSYHFFKTLVIFWLLAATDGHAKNFSIQLHKGGEYSLAPLYDVLSAHPVVGRRGDQIPKQKLKLAMAVVSASKHYLIYKIVARHWISFGIKLGFTAEVAASIVAEVYHQTPGAIESARAAILDDLNGVFPDKVAESIFTGMMELRERLTVIAE